MSAERPLPSLADAMDEPDEPVVDPSTLEQMSGGAFRLTAGLVVGFAAALLWPRHWKR